MKGFSTCLIGATMSVAAGVFSPSVFGATAELEQAVSLLRDTRTDRCQQSALRARLLVAHRSHDEKTVDELFPQLEALNARMKPADDKLKTLAAVIRLNSQEQNAFETAQIENGSCE